MNVIVGISGGIAAYKSPDLVRRLKEQGADVHVVMTKSAEQFISALTLQAVSGRAVSSELFDEQAEAAMGHIELARWADVILIAPATADVIARIAAGMANDLLTTLCLATKAPLVIAPAMNQQMWANPATAANIQILKERGVTILGPGSGEQACGDIGLGRMLEPDDLANQLLATSAVSSNTSDELAGKKLVITAGPTQEAIDPVRYLTNHSSGKMGFALAAAAQQAGAEVILISGPVTLETPKGVTRIDVVSAVEMHAQVQAQLAGIDIFIGCAAVADYRVEQIAAHKIKKNDQQLVLTMVENPDIIASVASHSPKPFCVGFAAETQDLAEHAQQKMHAKGLDMICANDVSNSAIGFNSEQNAVSVYINETTEKPYAAEIIDQAPKQQVAKQIINKIIKSVNKQ
jgi:phosphopantothenoylcysteine decarboxylase / phosphopantothenate---cysteine ligase